MNGILVVEDDPGTSDILKAGLAALGYKVDCCGNGMEALEYLKTRKPDVLLLALMMPVMDGFSFLSEFKKKYADSGVKIVIVSDKNMGGIFGPGSRFGNYRFIEKPFQLDELEKAIQQVIKE